MSSHRPRFRVAISAVAAVVMAGSLATSSAGARAPSPAPPVIAIFETGLNVLHEDFKLSSPPRFPRGMPEFETVKIPRSGDFDSRLAAAKKGPLGHLENDTLYWVEGTKVFIYEADANEHDLFADTFHGTGVASAAVGNKHGSYPDAWLVLVRQRQVESWQWAAKQRWIDIVSTSYFTAAASNSPCLSGDAIRAIVEDGRMVFSAAGNTEQVGMTAEPSGFPDSYQVGGVDSEGRTYMPDPSDENPGTTTRLYETGDRFDFPAASDTSLTGSMAFGGTSGATPTTAGRAAELVQYARTLLGSPGGISGKALAQAGRKISLPDRGPLEDGVFTNEELTRLLHHIATPAEEEGQFRYLIEGFGALSDDTTKLGKAILAGEAEEPKRDEEDAMHEQVESVRPVLNARCS